MNKQETKQDEQGGADRVWKPFLRYKRMLPKCGHMDEMMQKTVAEHCSSFVEKVDPKLIARFQRIQDKETLFEKICPLFYEHVKLTPAFLEEGKKGGNFMYNSLRIIVEAIHATKNKDCINRRVYRYDQNVEGQVLRQTWKKVAAFHGKPRPYSDDNPDPEIMEDISDGSEPVKESRDE